MDPYIHASSSRGEGFRIDDISNIDKFAWQQAQIDEALSKKPKRKSKSGRLRQLLKNVFLRFR